MTTKIVWPKEKLGLGHLVIKNPPERYATTILAHVQALEYYPALWEAQKLVARLTAWTQHNPPEVELVQD